LGAGVALKSGVRALLAPRLLGQKNRWMRASGAERTTIVFFGVIGLAFWVGVFLLFGWLVSTFHGVEIFGPILSRKLLEMMMLGLFGLLCFSNVISALSTFYLSDDLDLVLSLPVSRVSFHFARLADSVTQSSWMLAFFGLPIFVAYGWAYGAGWTYVIALAIVLPAFVAIPAGIGVATASALVRVFPARKIREALVLAGIICLVVGFVLLRAIRPERLVDAESFDSVAAYVANLQSPVPILTPPRWASDVLVAALLDKPLPWLELGMLVFGAVAVTGMARWLTVSVYDEGRTRAQEARTARLAKAGWLDRLLAVWTLPLAPVARAIVIKDVKTFIRDPSQWSQTFLVGSIVVITIASVAALPLDVFRGQWADYWRNFFAYGAHSLVGFIMAAVAARFQFTAVSNERRAFWIARTAPITAEQFLWAKVWPTIVPMVLVGEILAVASTKILGADPVLIAISAGTAFGLAFAISGIAVGMGATWPDFKADNAARVASGPAGVLFMVMSLLLTALVVALELLPTLLLLRARFEERALAGGEWAGVVLPLLAAVALCVFATVWPIKRGARALWSRELPNS
jgi:ABC-2 type transport system permease protein